MYKELILEIIKLVAVVMGAILASGGIFMYYIKRHDRINDLLVKYERLAEGVKLGLENDVVIFNALRNGHINGESEEQEKKMKEYFYNNSMKGFDLTK